MSPFIKWLMSPLADWRDMGMKDKALVAGAGALTGYLMRKLPPWQLVAWIMGASYGTALVLNSARSYAVPALPALPAGGSVGGSIGAGQPTNGALPNGMLPGNNAYPPPVAVSPEQSKFPEPPLPMPTAPILSNSADKVESEDGDNDGGIFG